MPTRLTSPALERVCPIALLRISSPLLTACKLPAYMPSSLLLLLHALLQHLLNGLQLIELRLALRRCLHLLLPLHHLSLHHLLLHLLLHLHLHLSHALLLHCLHLHRHRRVQWEAHDAAHARRSSHMHRSH